MRAREGAREGEGAQRAGWELEGGGVDEGGEGWGGGRRKCESDEVPEGGGAVRLFV